MLQLRAFALLLLGRLPQALQGAAHAERLALEHDDAFSIWAAWQQKTVLALAQGEPDTGRMAALRTIEAAERLGMPIYFAGAYTALANALVECGQWGDALSASERGFAILRNEFAGTWIEIDLGLRDATGRALLGADEIEPARAAAHEMLALCARVPKLGLPRVLTYLGAGHVLLRSEGPASPPANEALDRTARLIEEFHLWSLRPPLHLEYAERARLPGDTATSEHHLREAHQLFTSGAASSNARAAVSSSAKSPAAAWRFARHQSSMRCVSCRATAVRTTRRFTTFDAARSGRRLRGRRRRARRLSTTIRGARGGPRVRSHPDRPPRRRPRD